MHRVTGAEKQSGLPTFGARVGSRMINTLTRRMCFSTPRACFQLGILLFVPAPTLTALDVARRAPIGKDLPSQIDHYVSGGGWVSAVTGRPLQAHESNILTIRSDGRGGAASRLRDRFLLQDRGEMTR